MNNMQEKYGDEGLVIIGVNLDAVDADAQAFLKETPADFRIINDPQGALAREHDVVAMPTSTSSTSLLKFSFIHSVSVS